MIIDRGTRANLGAFYAFVVIIELTKQRTTLLPLIFRIPSTFFSFSSLLGAWKLANELGDT